MGASAWDYVADYRGDLQSTLNGLHLELFNGGETWFRGELDRWGLPQPSTLAELWSEPYYEFLGTHGTHSILDLPSLDDIKPLTPQETVEAFGTEQPSRADWDRVAGEDADGVDDYLGSRWTGRCVTLYQAGAPVSVAFWGSSGD